MYGTYLDAELLKEEAGIRGGGRPLEKSVKHISLNWSPDEHPTREQIAEAADDFLKHMKWDEHQVALVSHNDKPHAHVHLMINAVHPETGMKLDDFLERRRAQQWALDYERENGNILCQQRLLDADEREPSPTRETWLKLKESEKEHGEAEQARRRYDPDYMNKEENRKTIESNEWEILKDYQRERREAFFAEGKEVFRERRNEIFQAVREEFKPEWREYFAAKKDGMDEERLSDMKTDILARQNAALDERRSCGLGSLREHRDDEYALILSGQKEMRDELRDRQAQGLRSPDLLYLNHDPDIVLERYRQEAQEETVRADDVRSDFRQSAEEVCGREDTQGDEHAPFATFAENPRVRGGVDAFGDLGMGAIGGLATIGERLFDGFLGSPTPQRESAKPAPEPSQERPRENPFLRVADAARKNAEAMEEQQRNRAYWEDRGRDRGRWD
nr:relaxase/mobilization nuclease domain-containing protein [Rhodopseudomonas rhenobacensis]